MKGTSRPEHDFEHFIELAYRISDDVGDKVKDVLTVGRERPLTPVEASSLLTKVITILKDSARRRGDTATLQALKGKTSEIVGRIMKSRNKTGNNDGHQVNTQAAVALEGRKGIRTGPVLPSPWFHGREVAMRGGYIKTDTVQLWESNDRLDIHISQFRKTHGRKPTPDELLHIMLSKMQLPGVTAEDQFKIKELANSIAINGVRRPPILDLDGTLLDGNRRVASCYYILSSDEFSSEQKQRVQYIYVWQLTEHATNDDRNAVVVSLNFESDCKQPWPEYVKARKVYEDWQTILAVEPRVPGPERVRQLKRELSSKFALGNDPTLVNRYLRMVEWADEFERYHATQGRDQYEVKHRAEEYFQYFDELSKGVGPGGVAHTLNQDENYKHLVFDLLFQGKFKNWTLIRRLKFQDQDVREGLTSAREEADLEEARDLIEQVLTDASNRRRETRVSGANTRIETFVKWLEDLPMTAFKKEIRSENLQRLLDALQLVEKVISS